MTSFNKADTNPMGWNEFDELVDQLISQIAAYFQDHKQKVNVMAPLLRTGGIVGGVLSIKMKVITMLPVQFKYLYNPTRIDQIISVPDILSDLPEPMNILLCEGNTSSGSIAMKASTVIKEKYPRARIYLATLTKVYGCPEKLEGIEAVFFGAMTDESFKASEEEKVNLNLRQGITIFPWEDIEDELSDINAIQ